MQPIRRPCPFCGGKRQVLRKELRLRRLGSPPEYEYWYFCLSCACHGPWYKSAGLALKAWNGFTSTDKEEATK